MGPVDLLVRGLFTRHDSIWLIRVEKYRSLPGENNRTFKLLSSSNYHYYYVFVHVVHGKLTGISTATEPGRRPLCRRERPNAAAYVSFRGFWKAQ